LLNPPESKFLIIVLKGSCPILYMMKAILIRDVILCLFLNLENKSPGLVRYTQILEYSTVTHLKVSDVLITYSCVKLLIGVLLTTKNYNGTTGNFCFSFFSD
jgi:hypothetical protein